MAIDETTLPTQAGAFFDFQSKPDGGPIQTIGGIVAVAAPATWGDINVVKVLDRPSDITKHFGRRDSALRRAATDAFKGMGYDGFGGAGRVLAIRQAVTTGSGQATKAVRVLNNINGQAALTLTAKKFGSDANDVKTTVQSSTSGGKELLVMRGTYVEVTYQSPSGDMNALAAEITANSPIWDATPGVTGVALADVSGVGVGTTGTDGATITAAEWTETQRQLDRHRWNVLAPYGLTDAAVRTAVKTWMIVRNSLGRRSFCYFGGLPGEAIATANARSQALNDYNIVNLGGGSITRNDENGRVVGTAEMVARVAGARAFLGERSGDLFMRFADCEIESSNGATPAEAAVAIAAGTTVFSRDEAAVPVVINESVTTYTNDSASPTFVVNGDVVKARPVDRYSDIKSVAIQHGIELEIGDGARSGNFLGKLGNNEKSQQLVMGLARDAYERREGAQIVQPGWTVTTDGPPDYTKPYMALVHGYDETPTLRQMFNKITVG